MQTHIGDIPLLGYCAPILQFLIARIFKLQLKDILKFMEESSYG